MKTLLVSLESGGQLIVLDSVVTARQNGTTVRVERSDGWTDFVLEDRESAEALLDHIQKCLDGVRGGVSSRWPPEVSGG